MSHNPTSKEYSMPSQESEAVSPNLPWLAAICQVFSEKNQAMCVSQGFGIFPPLTQRQLHLKFEMDAEVVELRKTIMCADNG